MEWNDEQIDALKRDWAAGDSGGVIAARFGCTRNAVVGKVHRLGLPKRATFQMMQGARGFHESQEPKPPKPRARGPQIKPPRTRITEQHHVIEVFDAEVTELPPDQSECAVSFMDHKDHMCRWPIGDTQNLETFRFCGADRLVVIVSKKEHGLPYWKRHCRLAYRAPQKRKRSEAERERQKRQGRANYKAGLAA
jgi:GcrA cell cycle regulator